MHSLAQSHSDAFWNRWGSRPKRSGNVNIWTMHAGGAVIAAVSHRPIRASRPISGQVATWDFKVVCLPLFGPPLILLPAFPRSFTPGFFFRRGQRVIPSLELYTSAVWRRCIPSHEFPRPPPLSRDALPRSCERTVSVLEVRKEFASFWWFGPQYFAALLSRGSNFNCAICEKNEFDRVATDCLKPEKLWNFTCLGKNYKWVCVNRICYKSQSVIFLILSCAGIFLICQTSYSHVNLNSFKFLFFCT